MQGTHVTHYDLMSHFSAPDGLRWLEHGFVAEEEHLLHGHRRPLSGTILAKVLADLIA